VTTGFVRAWLAAFLVTQAVEAPVYMRGYGATLGPAFTASAITHPIVWFVIFGPIGLEVETTYLHRLLFAESFAWLVEAGFLHVTVRKPHALAWAFAANAASVAVGALSRACFGFP
jgi:hypothetical protein